ncbi:MAG: hypothetical protein RIE06_08590 [Roseibium album]|uniref:hypothetical protein n=1 Tax=Roseibium album TaxID=311410 RepID=UPI0032EDA19F
MGIVVLADDTDVPFQSRLLRALAEKEINRRSDRGIWAGLVEKFLGSGSMLEISVLNTEELVVFKQGIDELVRQFHDAEMYDGFHADGFRPIAETLRSSFAH